MIPAVIWTAIALVGAAVCAYALRESVLDYRYLVSDHYADEFGLPHLDWLEVAKATVRRDVIRVVIQLLNLTLGVLAILRMVMGAPILGVLFTVIASPFLIGSAALLSYNAVQDLQMRRRILRLPPSAHRDNGHGNGAKGGKA